MISLTDVIQVVDQLSPEDKAKLRRYIDGEQLNAQSIVATRRVAGLHEHLGHAWVSDDFDNPLPESFWLGNDE